MRLARTKQCAKCPWKKSTNPHDIPDGYCEVKHAALSKTIAQPGEINLSGPLHIMACHHSFNGREQHCIGWLYNQLGEGNNVALRLKMRGCENLGEMKVYGKQHAHFKDTLPHITPNDERSVATDAQ